MKKSYSNLVDEIIATEMTDRQLEAIYKSNPVQSQRLRKTVALTKTLEKLQAVSIEDKQAFHSLIRQLKVDDLVDEPAQKAQGFGYWFASKTRVYIPMAGVLLLVLLGGAWAASNGLNQPNSSTGSNNQSHVSANGSVTNVNSAVMQDNSTELKTATTDDGSIDIYTASAAKLQRLGESTNANF